MPALAPMAGPGVVLRETRLGGVNFGQLLENNLQSALVASWLRQTKLDSDGQRTSEHLEDELDLQATQFPACSAFLRRRNSEISQAVGKKIVNLRAAHGVMSLSRECVESFPQGLEASKSLCLSIF